MLCNFGIKKATIHFIVKHYTITAELSQITIMIMTENTNHHYDHKSPLWSWRKVRQAKSNFRKWL